MSMSLIESTGAPMSQEKTIPEQVQNVLFKNHIDFFAEYDGEVTRDKWACDSWKTTFTNGNNDECSDFDFFTGLGHRVKSKPQAPDAATVLHSLILDSSAVGQSFDSWCSEFGLDSNSRKAYGIYEACQKNADKLSRIMSAALIAELSELLQDF